VAHETLESFLSAVNSGAAGGGGMHTVRGVQATLVDFIECCLVYKRCPATLGNLSACGARISDQQVTASGSLSYVCPIGHRITMAGPTKDLATHYGSSAEFVHESSGAVFRAFVSSQGLTTLLGLSMMQFGELTPEQQICQRRRVQGKLISVDIDCDLSTQQGTLFVNRATLLD
jgi:hypothetical protein